ncbi:MAG TPA: glycosyltransferase family 4 protein [Thermoplasmata archaeon]
MKVFVVSGKNPRLDPGGYAAYARVLGECLAELGHDVHFVCFGPRDGRMDARAGPIHVVGSRLLPRRTEFYPAWSALFARTILRMIPTTGTPVAVHGIGPWCLAGTIARERSRAVKVVASYFTTLRDEARGLSKGVAISDYGIGPKVRHLIGYLGVLATLDPIERYAVGGTELVLVHYEYTRRLLIEGMGIDPSRIVKIPYAAGPEPKRGESVRRADGPERFEILSVGRQEPRKGINVLLRALRILRDRGVRFHATIIGSGSLLEAHRALARRLALSDVVAFPGFVPDLAPYLGAADVFVLPSLQEGSGSISLLEAMSAGLPPVVSACDGLPEDVQDGVNGLLAAPANPQHVADALESLFRDTTLRFRLGSAARESYRARFQSTAMSEALRHQYDGLFPRSFGDR